MADHTDTSNTTATEDYEPRMPQDDFDWENKAVDPVLAEETEDITRELGVNPKEFKEELDKYAIDETGNGDDDMRESIEDQDDLNEKGS